MIFDTIWERYIFKSLLKGFFLVLFCFFFLYALIDFSTHAHDFIIHGKVVFSKIYTFYLYQFIKRLIILLPLALLIAAIRTLSSLNIHRELVAFQACGLKMKKLLRPLFLLGIFCALFSYANEQVFLPKSIAYLDQVKQEEGRGALTKDHKKQFAVLYLDDASKLIYQKFDKEKGAFFDVYWIRSFHDIWRMKYLSADPKNPVAEYADHIIRTKEGFLEKTESFEKISLPYLKWEESQLSKKQSSIKHQPISDLFLLTLKNDKRSFHLRGEIQTHFFHKVAMPLLPLLVLFGVIPFLISYSRNPPIFLIYGISIFAFVVFFTLMNALVIIGENQVLPPYIAIFSPFLLCFGVSYVKFRKMV